MEERRESEREKQNIPDFHFEGRKTNPDLEK